MSRETPVALAISVILKPSLRNCRIELIAGMPIIFLPAFLLDSEDNQQIRPHGLRSACSRLFCRNHNADFVDAHCTKHTRFATALHHCAIIAATGSFETDDAERWSKPPEGMTYEEWKAGDAARQPHDSSGRTMGEFLEQPSVKAQLEKRGMTEGQARKALSEHLKVQGTSGNAFGAMRKTSSSGSGPRLCAIAIRRTLTARCPSGFRAARGCARSPAECLKRSKIARAKT